MIELVAIHIYTFGSDWHINTWGGNPPHLPGGVYIRS